MSSKKTLVFFQGTFDILNVCHVKCFKLAKSYGDKLIIGLNTDDLVRQYKKREPIMPYLERKEMLLALKYVDEVVQCDNFSCMKQLKKLLPDVFVLGQEWISTHPDEIAFVKSYGGVVKFTKTYTQLHSSQIRKKIIKHGN